MTTAAYYGVPTRSVIAALAIARAARRGARMTTPVIPFPTPAQRLLRQSRRRGEHPPHHPNPEPPRAA